MLGWLADNWDKILTTVVSIIAAVYAAVRKFTARLDAIESRINGWESKVADMEKSQERISSDIRMALERLEGRLSEVADIKSWITANDARMDVVLKTIQNDIRELKDDVKQLMRGK